MMTNYNIKSPVLQFVGDPWIQSPVHSRGMPVCQKCHTRWINWKFGPYNHGAISRGLQEPDSLSFDVSRSELSQSAKSGCTLCMISMKTLQLNATTDQLEITYQLLNTNPQKDPHNLDLLRVQEGWKTAERECDQRMYDFWMHAAPDDPASKYFKTRNVNPIVHSDSTYNLARQWIEECSSTHVDCPRSNTTNLPTRVIDLESDTRDQGPKLLVTNGRIAPYAALSYCWGCDQPDSLRADRLSLYTEEGIPDAKIPQTIKDAISVTKSLGLRYLWVDSLCIVQDSKSDKRKEISNMRRIFRNALITISAATAKSVLDGFLHQRPASIPSVSAPVTCPNGMAGTVSLYLDEQEPHLTYTNHDHPIEDRAWTLEEKVLSPRVLIFSSTHVRWLCDSRQYGDGGPQENFLDYDAAKYRLPLKRRTEASHPSQNNVPSESLHNSWRDLLGEYTGRLLTAPEDRLRAIGGLAEEYGSLMNDSYYAGLWASELPTELLWRRNSLVSCGSLQARPELYRAPSWSWASIDSAVAIKSGRISSVKFDVVECIVRHASPSFPFGEVTEGILKVSARVKPLLWNRTDERCYDLDTSEKTGIGVPDAIEEKSYTLEVYALAISANHGLLLIETGLRNNTYRRVGWMYFDNDDFFADIQQSITTVI